MGAKEKTPQSIKLGGIPGEAWQLFFNHSPAMICVIGYDQKFKLVNPAWTQVLGWSEKELLGTKYVDLIHPDEVEQTLAYARKHRDEGEVVSEYENRYRCKDGSYRWLLWHAFPSLEHKMVYGIVHDISERKEVEESLRAFQEIIKQSSDSIICTDTEFRITYINPAAEEMYGYSLEEVIGQTPGIFNAEPASEEFQQEIYQTVSAGKAFSHEALNVRKDGSTLYCLMKISPMVNENGIITGYIGSQEDITERKQTEEALRREKDFTDIALNAQLDTFFLFEPDTGKAIRWNQAFRDITGYTDEEIASLKAPDSYYSPEDLSRAAEAVELIMNTGSGTIELDLICKDGRRVPTEYKVSLIRDEAGSPKHFISIGRDITNRKQSEEALRESEEKYRNLVERANDGIIIVQGGKVTFANHMLVNMLGYSDDEMLNTDFLTYIAPEGHAKIFDIYTRRLKGEDVPSIYDMKAICKDGTKFPVEINSGIITFQGKPAVMSFIRDITERKQAEEALRESEEKYRSLVERASDGIIIVQDGKVMFVNQKLLDIVGRSQEEMLDTEFLSYVAPEEHAWLTDIHLRRLKNGDVPSIYEMTAFHRDGTRISVESNTGLITYQGRPATLSFIRDITERKQTEEALKESEERFRSLSQATFEGIAITEDGVLIDVNEQLPAMMGYKKDELVGKKITDFVVPEDHASINKGIIQKGEKLNEVRIICKDGRLINVEARPRFMEVEGRKLRLTAIRDVTNRKQAEEALRKSEEEYKTTLNNLSIAVIVHNADTSILISNPEAQNLLGLTDEEISGKKAIEPEWDFVHEDGRKMKPKEYPVNIVISTKKPLINYVAGINRPDQEKIIWVDVNAIPIFSNTNQIEKVVINFVDITERKQREALLDVRLKLTNFSIEHSIDELLQSFLDDAEELTGSEIGFFHFVEDDQVNLTLQMWSTNTLSTMCTAEGKGSHYPIDRAGVWVDCVKERKPVIHNDYSSLKHKKGLPKGHAPITRQLVAPVIRGEKIKAIFGVGNKKTDYGEEDVATMMNLADLAWEIVERKRAEEALRESEIRFKTAFNQSYQFFIICAPDGTLLEVNDLVFESAGSYGKDALGKKFWHVNWWASPPEDIQTDVEKTAKGQIVTGEAQVYEKDGNILDVSYSMSPVKNEAGELIYLAIQGVNVTDAKQKEEALRESEEKFRNIIESSPMGMHMYQLEEDGQLVFTGANPAADSILGVDNSQFIGKTIEEAFPPLADTEIPQRYREAAAQGKSWSTHQFNYEEERIIGAFEVYAFQTSPGRMAAMFLDITERIKAEIALKDSEAKMRSIFRVAPIGIGVAVDRMFIDVNDVFCEMVGYSKEELIGKSAIMIYPNQEEFELIGQETYKLASEGGTNTGEFRFKHKNGRIIEVLGNSTLLDPTAPSQGAIFTVLDITERKQAEEALIESEKRATALLEAIPDMMFRMDNQGIFLDFKADQTELYNQDENAVIGNSVKEAFPPAFSEFVIQKIKQTLDSGEMQTFEYQLPLPDRGMVDYEARMVKDEEDAVVCIVRDISERKEAAQIINTSPAVAFLWKNEEDWPVEFVSENVKELFGFPAEEFLSNQVHYFDFIHSDDLERVVREIETYSKDKETSSFTHKPYRIITRQDEVKWVDEKIFIRRDLEGSITHYQGLVIDVTAQIEAESITLRLGRIIEESQNEIYIFDAETLKFSQVNRGARNNLGYSMDELDKLTPLDLKPDFTPEKFEKLIEPLRTGEKEQLTFTTRHKRKDESLYPVEVYLQLLKYEETPTFVAIILDITDRIKAEEALRESELRYRTVADYNYDWEFWINPDGSMRYVSPSCERVTGYTAEEFISNPSLRREIMISDTIEDWEVHKRLSEESQGLHELIYAIHRKDGELRWIEHFCQPVTGEDGTYLGIRGSDRDITERKKAEEEIRKLNNELEQRVIDRTAELAATNQELEAFAYSISHDLRAPLRAINSFSEILQIDYEDRLDDEGKGYLSRVQVSAKRMNKLIDDLLALSRLGRKEMRLTTTNLTHIAEQVFSEIIKQEPGRDIDFNVLNMPLVNVDTSLIEVALTNLLGNAVKFTRGKKTAKIELGIKDKGEEPVFYIKDNGVGFDMKYADKLFSPFQRLHSETEFEGTGIGLAIVHRIIQRHGGKIWVESKPNKGSTFFFTLG